MRTASHLGFDRRRGLPGTAAGPTALILQAIGPRLGIASKPFYRPYVS